MSEERVSALMELIGGVPIASASGVEDDAWRVDMGDVEIDLALRRARGILQMTASLSSPPETRRHDVCMLALLYNQTWNATGGARIDWTDWQFRLHQDVSIELSDDEQLAADIESFSSKCVGWRRLFEQMPAVAPERKQMLEVLSAPGLIKT